jgi:hypothetical protein
MGSKNMPDIFDFGELRGKPSDMAPVPILEELYGSIPRKFTGLLRGD